MEGPYSPADDVQPQLHEAAVRFLCFSQCLSRVYAAVDGPMLLAGASRTSVSAKRCNRRPVKWCITTDGRQWVGRARQLGFHVPESHIVHPARIPPEIEATAVAASAAGLRLLLVFDWPPEDAGHDLEPGCLVFKCCPDGSMKRLAAGEGVVEIACPQQKLVCLGRPIFCVEGLRTTLEEGAWDGVSEIHAECSRRIDRLDPLVPDHGGPSNNRKSFETVPSNGSVFTKASTKASIATPA